MAEKKMGRTIFLVALMCIFLIIFGSITKSQVIQIDLVETKTDNILEYQETKYNELVNQTNQIILETKLQTESDIIEYIKNKIVSNGYVQIGLGNNQSLTLVPYRGE